MLQVDVINALATMESKDDCKRLAQEAMRLSEDERVIFAGELAKKRYENTQQIPLVFRQVNHSPNMLIMQIFRDNNYPVPASELEKFFKNPQQEKVSAIPENVLNALLPFYHEYMKDVGKETKKESISKILGFGTERHKEILVKLGVKVGDIKPEEMKKLLENKLNGLSEEKVKEIRGSEAKVSFIDQVAFAFLDQRAHEIKRQGIEDGANVKQNATLQAEFRKVRKDPKFAKGLIEKLDAANNKDYKPPGLNTKLLAKTQELYKNGKYHEVFKDVAFAVATDSKNFPRLKKYIEFGVDLNSKNKDGSTLLSIVQKNYSQEQVNELEKLAKSIRIETNPLTVDQHPIVSAVNNNKSERSPVIPQRQRAFGKTSQPPLMQSTTAQTPTGKPPPMQPTVTAKSGRGTIRQKDNRQARVVDITNPLFLSHMQHMEEEIKFAEKCKKWLGELSEKSNSSELSHDDKALIKAMREVIQKIDKEPMRNAADFNTKIGEVIKNNDIKMENVTIGKDILDNIIEGKAPSAEKKENITPRREQP